MSAGGDQVSTAGDGVFRHRYHVPARRNEVSGRLHELPRIRYALSAGGDAMSRDHNEVQCHHDPMPTHRNAVSPLFRGPDGGHLAGDGLTRLRVQARGGRPAAGITVSCRGNPLSHGRRLPGHGQDIEIGTGVHAIPWSSTGPTLLPVKSAWVSVADVDSRAARPAWESLWVLPFCRCRVKPQPR